MFKYVIDKHRNVVIGTLALTHVQLARGLESEPVSAGFIRFEANPDENTYPYTSGESVSLNLKSRGREDNEIIERHMQGY